MTDEVAALCLRNTYLQSLALSLAERRGAADLPDHIALIEALERRRPSRSFRRGPARVAALAERQASGRGLTRPELAVLLAYAKNALTARAACLVRCRTTRYLTSELFRYFPDRLKERYFRNRSRRHRLRREVIATVLANAMINRAARPMSMGLLAATRRRSGRNRRRLCGGARQFRHHRAQCRDRRTRRRRRWSGAAGALCRDRSRCWLPRPAGSCGMSISPADFGRCRPLSRRHRRGARAARAGRSAGHRRGGRR